MAKFTRNPSGGRVPGRFGLVGEITPAQVTADQNNYNPSGWDDAAVLRITSNAERKVTGLAGGVKGRIAILDNAGTNDFLLTGEDTASLAANRFELGGAGRLRMPPDARAWFRYDNTTSLWSLVAHLAGLTEKDHGTVTTGTTTLSRAEGEQQIMTNNGASAIAAPADVGTIVLQITNGASAGALTITGYAKELSGGDSFDTTNGNDFLFISSVVNGFKSYQIRALQ